MNKRPPYLPYFSTSMSAAVRVIHIKGSKKKSKMSQRGQVIRVAISQSFVTEPPIKRVAYHPSCLCKAAGKVCLPKHSK